jgi:hypothetical protein
VIGAVLPVADLIGVALVVAVILVVVELEVIGKYGEISRIY